MDTEVRDEPGPAQSPHSDGEDQALLVKLGILTDVLADNCVHIIWSTQTLAMYTPTCLFVVFKMTMLLVLSEYGGLPFLLHSVEFSRIRNQMHPFPLLQLETNVLFQSLPFALCSL